LRHLPAQPEDELTGHSDVLRDGLIAQPALDVQRHSCGMMLISIRPPEPMFLVGRTTCPGGVLLAAPVHIAADRSLAGLLVRQNAVESIRRPYFAAVAVDLNGRQFLPGLDQLGQFRHILIVDPLPALDAAVRPDRFDQ
jgi:hypothetical protein